VCMTILLQDVTIKLYSLVMALLVCAHLKRRTYELANPLISIWVSNYSLVSRTQAAQLANLVRSRRTECQASS
jgi:hypothetical protein